ncbi:UNVERIFIED_CONTAM: hypothetical protein FKN15_000827 [Acipenser sinensis]
MRIKNISGKGPVLGRARDSRRVQKDPGLIRRLEELNRRVVIDLEGHWVKEECLYASRMSRGDNLAEGFEL